MSEVKPLAVLGVTGGIAAFKAAALCSAMVKSGIDVQVVMTANACRFVTPLTFQTLSRRDVVTSLWENPQWQPEHVALADAAKLFVCAPCSANFIGKYACGIADDALSTFALTFRGPALLAPAMNPGMWQSPAVQDNMALLAKRRVNFIGPESGRVACGADGEGRMSEPDAIFRAVRQFL